MIDYSQPLPPVPVPKKILEKDVEAYLVRRVKACGGLSYKWSHATRVGGNRSGVFDRIVIWPAIPEAEVWFVELKRDPSCNLSKHQLSFAAEMDSLGMKRKVCLKGKAEVDEWIANHAS